MRRGWGIAVAIAVCLPLAAAARGGGGHGGHSSYSSSSAGHAASHSSSTYSTHSSGRSTKAVGVERDSHGRIKRSSEARHEFQKSHPCPSTGATSGACPGYVVDHVTALKRGGADNPSNMQWQTDQDAKIKDRTE